eukprot:TRINITY_DN53190_c0_g1_i3.p3 TRINITY_DN53190_c0_g1~~TRINITY_DN53190_c0_g1_i3.p3  ORF type:complete len:132 (-),score=7.91 TRINITY_DN53190_c0_g1_i3:37-432(-)
MYAHYFASLKLFHLKWVYNALYPQPSHIERRARYRGINGEYLWSVDGVLLTRADQIRNLQPPEITLGTEKQFLAYASIRSAAFQPLEGEVDLEAKQVTSDGNEGTTKQEENDTEHQKEAKNEKDSTKHQAF